ncbi:MAG: hypothetical protein JXB05_07210 [Myxococcaceae bacterium]|nr:hypothetical protein [Myxococcaceae bacterium]
MAALLSVLAMGCLGEGRPLEEYLADYERIQREADGGSPAADPGCSRDEGGRVWLRFVNGYTDVTVQYFWVDRQCQEHLYGTLPPGKAVDQDSYAGHLWRVRRQEDGALLREHRAEASSERVVVEVP